jgi:hypothetical protein
LICCSKKSTVSSIAITIKNAPSVGALSDNALNRYLFRVPEILEQLALAEWRLN